MIPKIIHYCWFGRNLLFDMALKCIDSWKKNCPDYEIVEWNEDNFDLDYFPYDAYVINYITNVKSVIKSDESFASRVVRKSFQRLKNHFYYDYRENERELLASFSFKLLVILKGEEQKTKASSSCGLIFY